ncbi:MAG: DUF2905 domain-containing protein [Deltaproteobacteria bacterium]|nr:DUF2905 domain-containing protein [Deltaproteobacteria bacterium]
MQRLLLVIGASLLLAGVTYPWWSRAAHLLWELPGNIAIRKGHFQLYFPLTLCLIVSLVLTLLSWFMRR